MNIIYEHITEFTIEETLDRVKKELGKVGFGVLWELDFKDKLKEKGFDYPNHFWVLEVCNPGKAVNVLSENQKAGYFLPCKVVVYEQDSKVHLGFMQPGSMLSQMPEFASVVSVAQEVEEILRKVIDEVAI